MESFWDKLLSGSEAILEPLHVPLFTAGGSQIDTFDILEFCLVFLIAYWLGKLGEESIRKFGSRHNSVRPESLSMFARFIHWGILAVGILMGLSMIGLPITHLAILVSALSVGIGFGLQTIVNNSVAGLILISERAGQLRRYYCHSERPGGPGDHDHDSCHAYCNPDWSSNHHP